MGVIFSPLDALWETRFVELVAFKAREGHCDVPLRYPENPALGTWLGRQRKAKQRGRLSGEREARLRKLGVAFETRSRRQTRPALAPRPVLP